MNDEIAERRYSSAFGEYACECGRKTCVMPISLMPDEFAEIRARPGRFVVHPGHASEALERVVEQSERFHVVESLDDSSRLLHRRSMRPLGVPEWVPSEPTKRRLA
jgi:hypothetical protein